MKIPKECTGCKWLSICGGGCPAENFMINKSFGRNTQQCKIRKSFFKHIEGKIKSGK